MTALVREAWAAALAPLKCDYEQTWQESGGDSQAIVYLISGLEEALGRRLPYDLFMLDTTAEELASKLCGEPSSEPATSGAAVFFVPGAFGDEPYIHEFERALGDRIRLRLVDLADVAEPNAVLLSIPRLGALVADEIAARQPEGPILLAGASYGGTVAFEAARRLAAAGRQLAFLAILDAALSARRYRSDAPSTIFDMPGKRRLLRKLYANARWHALLPLLETSSFRRIALRLATRLSIRSYVRLRRKLLRHLRDQSLVRWNPTPLNLADDTVVLLTASEQYALAITAAWKRLCSGSDVAVFPGKHSGFLQSPALIAAFQRGVRKASAKRETVGGNDR